MHERHVQQSRRPDSTPGTEIPNGRHENGGHRCDMGLLVTQAAKDWIEEEFNYRTHRPANKSPMYDDEVTISVAKQAILLQVLMKSQDFDSLEQISIIRIFQLLSCSVILMSYNRMPPYSCNKVLWSYPPLGSKPASHFCQSSISVKKKVPLPSNVILLITCWDIRHR